MVRLGVEPAERCSGSGAPFSGDRSVAPGPSARRSPSPPPPSGAIITEGRRGAAWLWVVGRRWAAEGRGGTPRGPGRWPRRGAGPSAATAPRRGASTARGLPPPLLPRPSARTARPPRWGAPRGEGGRSEPPPFMVGWHAGVGGEWEQAHALPWVSPVREYRADLVLVARLQCHLRGRGGGGGEPRHTARGRRRCSGGGIHTNRLPCVRSPRHVSHHLRTPMEDLEGGDVVVREVPEGRAGLAGVEGPGPRGTAGGAQEEPMGPLGCDPLAGGGLACSAQRAVCAGGRDVH